MKAKRLVVPSGSTFVLPDLVFVNNIISNKEIILSHPSDRVDVVPVIISCVPSILQQLNDLLPGPIQHPTCQVRLHTEHLYIHLVPRNGSKYLKKSSWFKVIIQFKQENV